MKDSAEAYLLVNDRVQNKQYPHHIEMVKKQYSGAEHGLVRGIGIVNLVHSDGEVFYPIDHRIYASEQDVKTKNRHFCEMPMLAKSDTAFTVQTDPSVAFQRRHKIQAQTDNELEVVSCGIPTVKQHSFSVERIVIHLQTLVLDDDTSEYGISVKLKDLPFRVQLLKVVATNGDIEWVITNQPEPNLSTHDLQAKNTMCWQIELLQRELKQLTSEQCQCRKASSQRNYLGCCYLAWLALRQRADQLKRSLYAVQHALRSDYLRAELRPTHITAFASL